jgi:hypothetical protein
MAFAPDGKIAIAGTFLYVDGVPQTFVARLNVDGSRDASFDSGTGTWTAGVTAVAVQADGKVLVGGDAAFDRAATRQPRGHPGQLRHV